MYIYTCIYIYIYISSTTHINPCMNMQWVCTCERVFKTHLKFWWNPWRHLLLWCSYYLSSRKNLLRKIFLLLLPMCQWHCTVGTCAKPVAIDKRCHPLRSLGCKRCRRSLHNVLIPQNNIWLWKWPDEERMTKFTWWRHQIETFSTLLAICAGNSPVPGEFPAQRPVTRGFDVFFGLRPNKRLSEQWWGWWFETPSSPLWRHYNESDIQILNIEKDENMKITAVLMTGTRRNPSVLCGKPTSKQWSINKAQKHQSSA